VVSLGRRTADLSASNHERPFDRLSERSIGVRKADRANGKNPILVTITGDLTINLERRSLTLKGGACYHFF